MSDERIEYIRCPKCKWVGELDECDVSGAAKGHVFCGNWRENGRVCSAEFPVERNLVVSVSAAQETQ